jgi:H+-transporting ATPase
MATSDASDINDHDEEGGGFKRPFVKSHGLTSREAEALLGQYGRNELEEKKTPKWLIFASQLYQPMPCMLWLAALVELTIKNWDDMAILIGIQFANASLSYYETTKANDAVAALKAALKPLAHVKRDGRVQVLDAALLVPGDMVILASGGAVPADCAVNEGTIDVDQAALTGESLPVTMMEGDEPKMGSTVVRGETEATVVFTGKDTFLGKTAAMLSGDPEVSNLQKLLIRIMVVLVCISLTLCAIVLVYLVSQGEAFTDALSFTVKAHFL